MTKETKEREQRRSATRRFGSWLADNAGRALIAAVITLAVSAFVATRISGGGSAPLGSQLDSIREEAAAEGKYAVRDEPVALHGRGKSSEFFVFRDKENAETYLSGRSDEIRIYDDEGGVFQEAFRFQPRVNRVPYRFVSAGVGRYDDETDRSEIVGEFVHQFVDIAVPLPVVVLWDENLGEYRLRSLLPAPPKLRPVRDPGGWGEVVAHGYKGEYLRDVASNTSVRVYGADRFSVRRKPFPIFAAAFTLRARCNECLHMDEVQAWRMNFEQPVPAIRPCDVGRYGFMFRWQNSPEGLDPVKEWLSHRRRGNVVPNC